MGVRWLAGKQPAAGGEQEPWCPRACAEGAQDTPSCPKPEGGRGGAWGRAGVLCYSAGMGEVKTVRTSPSLPLPLKVGTAAGAGKGLALGPSAFVSSSAASASCLLPPASPTPSAAGTSCFPGASSLLSQLLSLFVCLYFLWFLPFVYCIVFFPSFFVFFLLISGPSTPCSLHPL